MKLTLMVMPWERNRWRVGDLVKLQIFDGTEDKERPCVVIYRDPNRISLEVVK